MKIVGTVKDNVELKEYILSYRKKGSEDYSQISKGSISIIQDEIGIFDTTYLKNGVYEINLYAEDTAGNKSYLTADDVSAEDNRGIDKVEVFKNGEIIGTEEGKYTISENEAGINKIKVIVTDIDGNETIKEVEYIVIDDRDKIAPTVEINTPEHGKTISGLISIVGTAKDDKELARYTLKYRKVGDEKFTTFAEVDKDRENEMLGVLNTNVLENCMYEVRLIAEDKGGNISYTQYTYNVLNKSVDENIAPQISLVLSKQFASINEKVKAGIIVLDSDLKEYKVYMDGVEVKDNNGIFEFTSTTTKSVEIKVYAIDEKGNKAEVKDTCIFYNDLDKIAPTAKINKPDEIEILTAPTAIIGSAFDETEMDKYILDYKKKGDVGYTTIVDSNIEKNNKELGIFDTTMLSNGIYEVRLRVIDKGGNITTTKNIYTVEGKMKIGNMAFSFQDIKSNMNGISISVNRHYDNRNKQKGDFGIGWNLGLQDIKIYESYPLFEGYEQHKEGSWLFTKYVVSETVPHYVVVSYGDGTSDRFKVKLSNTSSPYVPLYETYIEFESVTNPDVKLQIDGYNAIELWGRTGEVQNIFEYTANNFILTQGDGTKLYINKDTGLKSIKEPNGNEIKVSRNGYTSANGKSIIFKRDSENRIVRAIDINGDVTSYNYDNNGDLVKVINPMNNTVNFKYDNNHNIIEIIDPTGASVSRNEYDENGRLIATIDGEGNRTEFDHNIDKNTEVVKDKNGNIYTYHYDDYGNLMKQIDPLGNVIENKFDENNNLISTIDQLGNIKKYGYDENNRLIG